jgi:uncharacterized protein (TIGR00255 family)
LRDRIRPLSRIPRAFAACGCGAALKQAEIAARLADIRSLEKAAVASTLQGVPKSQALTVISAQLVRLKSWLLRPAVPGKIGGSHKQACEQIARLLDVGASFDKDRLHQEAILIATRADIQEELDRLFAHLEAARHLMASPEPAGRKFDFLAQEFNREANTLCSKALDKTLTAIGLELKTVIDQMREQVQNIE